jgi:hypothetical protein
LGDRVKLDEMGRECGIYEGKRGLYRVLLGTSDGRRPLA